MTQATSAQKQDLVITRRFNAPLAAVWRAWSDADVIRQWWGPTHFSCPSCRLDFRVGGTTLVCMRAPAQFGGQDMYSTWDYTQIEPMRRIEYIHNLADAAGNKLNPQAIGMPPDFPQDQRHVVEFKSLGDNQTELTITEYDWTVGQMIEMSRMGMEQCLDKMGAAIGEDVGRGQ